MASQLPIDHFIELLEKPGGPRRLEKVRKKLGLADKRLRLKYESMGRRGKVFVVYSEDAPKKQRIVVKFNPLEIEDPYIDDVHKEYRILKKLYPELQGIVPEPLFCSSVVEERIVGTAFFVMTYIEGHIFRTVGEIQGARHNVVQVHVEAMKKLAKVHGVVLCDKQFVARHEETHTYWQEVVDLYKHNYRSTIGWWKWLFWADPQSYLFSEISKGRKPMSRRVSVVHGNVDIGNFVFDEKMKEVRAILNWKYEQNGDPLMDVASLLLPFMDIGNCTVQKPLQLICPDAVAEVSEVVKAYNQSSANEVSGENLEFAKAVCCLRQLCVLKRGLIDDFSDHEMEDFSEITNNAATVIDFLSRHCEMSYNAFRGNTGSKPPPIKAFIDELQSPESSGRLDQLKRKLDPQHKGLSLGYKFLEKGTVVMVYSKDAPEEQRIVVKFNPLGRRDPIIDDVHKEFRILTKLYPKLQSIVPEPLFCSSDVEEELIGTAFIVLSFIEGRTFRTVGEIQKAGGNVVQMHVATMKKLAEVHGVVLRNNELTVKHEVTQSYWQEVVDSCKQKYRKTVGWWRWLLGSDRESYLFSEISKGSKPRSRRVSVVHGSLGIENFVFNDEMTEVRAILHWKYEGNGDPLMDVASLLLLFMDVGNYTVEQPVQVIYPATSQEVSEVVKAYRQSLLKGFNDEELEFAKAVCCLRQICAVKRGIIHGFGCNELGIHPEIAHNPHTVVDLLHRRGEASYRAFRC